MEPTWMAPFGVAATGIPKILGVPVRHLFESKIQPPELRHLGERRNLGTNYARPLGNRIPQSESG